MPTVSIITPLLNRAILLPHALASVAIQDASAEHIIVDGGSTDGSAAIALASGATVIEAPGTSIYEAINIGITSARGDVICLLNSDDRLEKDAIAAAQAAFAGQPTLELARGRTRVETLEGQFISEETASESEPILANVLLGTPNINAYFFSARLFGRLGLFDPAFPVSADRAWLANALVDGVCFAVLDRLVYVYRSHADSKTIGGDKSSRMGWVGEHLSWAKSLLSDPRLSLADRRTVRAFHAKEAAHLALLGFQRGPFVGPALADCFVDDPLWPLHAAAPIIQAMARRRQLEKRRQQFKAALLA